MTIEFALIPHDQLAVALPHSDSASRAAAMGNVASLDEATAALQGIASPDSALHLPEQEWRVITQLFGRSVAQGELDFVIYGEALNRWITTAREAGSVRLAGWLESAKAAGHAVLQLPIEDNDE